MRIVVSLVFGCSLAVAGCGRHAPTLGRPAAGVNIGPPPPLPKVAPRRPQQPSWRRPVDRRDEGRVVWAAEHHPAR